MPSVPVTVYNVVVGGETCIDCIDAPVDHKYMEAPFAVRIAVLPGQIVTELEVTIGMGGIIT